MVHFQTSSPFGELIQMVVLVLSSENPILVNDVAATTDVKHLRET